MKEKILETMASLRKMRAGHFVCPSMDSAMIQLEYLLLFLQGGSDRSRLADINIGVIAVREIEAVDMELADLMHEIQGWVRRQLSQRE